ncbi:YqzL family protein [Pontibacillus chungwhensis]|nr:YqzL family protein [Pontibacillus chungwhensis]
MRDFTWKVFSQTGNIETYLLLKELETTDSQGSEAREHNEDYAEFDRQL